VGKRKRKRKRNRKTRTTYDGDDDDDSQRPWAPGRAMAATAADGVTINYLLRFV